MSIKLTRVTVADTAYPTDPQAVCEFQGVPLIARESGTPVVLVSFDGTNDHGALIASNIPQIPFRQAYPRVWLRLATAGTADVSIIHETPR